MAGNSRSISSIVVPMKTDIRQFESGLKDAQQKGKRAHAELSKSLDKITFGRGDAAAKALEKAFGAAGARSVLAVAKVTAGVAALTVAVGGAALAVTKLGSAHIAQIGRDAQSVGATAEAFSRLKGVARATGTEVGDLQEFMRGLTDSINSSIGKTTAQSEVFKTLGTSAEELARLPVEQQIQKLNKGFAGLPSDAARAEAAMKLAGATGIKTFRMLTAGTQEFDRAFNEAPVVTDDEVHSVRRLEIAFGKVADRVQQFADVVTTKLLPPIQRVADLVESLATGASKWLGLTLPAMRAPVAPGAAPTGPAAPNNAAVVAQQAKEAAGLAGQREAAAKAQAKVLELEKQAGKQAEQMRQTRQRMVRSTNGGRMVLHPTQQRMLDQHKNTMSQLAIARRDAENKSNAAMSPAEAMARASRGNTELVKAIADMRNEFRQDIANSGKDEIQRRLAGLKGLSSADRKGLEQDAYRAREANRTSALRDELQESTKLPQERLREDLDRIGRMIQNKSINPLQAIRGIAQKGAESGLAGGPVKLAGAVDRNSIEGRSARLDHTYGGNSQDTLAVAKQTLQQNDMQTGLLGQLVNLMGGQRQQMVMGY